MTSTLTMTPESCYRAVLARDARYDGRFFTCVRSTGIYCRPVCPAKAPKAIHCAFVPTAAAAQEAGFRPCLRCRPESAPHSPAWEGTSTTVARALRLIEAGALDEGSVEVLAERLGVGSRQLRRVFLAHVGASPVVVAQTRRLLLAKQLIHQTRLPMASVALASGFGSVRRFNEVFRGLYGKPPNDLRSRRDDAAPQADIELLLPYRPPYDWDAMLGFLAARAMAGVEQVNGRVYRRTIALEGDTGDVAVTDAPEASALRVSIRFPRIALLPRIIARLRQQFDLRADPAAILDVLGGDPLLAPLVRAHPGMRLPGAWDPFETAVRAILGQQVTVRAGVALAERLVERLGDDLPKCTASGLARLFPSPASFRLSAVQGMGMPAARAATLVSLARAFEADPRLFEAPHDLDEGVARLKAIPGIGDWTAHYVAMRALHENDAFLASDVALRRVVGGPDARPSARALVARAEAWRPWRAYAVMHLWRLDAATTGAASRATKRKETPDALQSR